MRKLKRIVILGASVPLLLALAIAGCAGGGGGGGGNGRGTPTATLSITPTSTPSSASECPAVPASVPPNDIWVARAVMLQPSDNFGATAGCDGRIYAIGGLTVQNGQPAYAPSSEVYNPATDSWATLSGPPTPRYDLSAVTGLDGRIYAIGGHGCVKNAAAVCSTVEAYDPGANSWACSTDEAGKAGCASTTLAPMPTPREGFALVRLSQTSTLYAIGGQVASGDTGVVEAYDPATNTWSCSVGDSSTGCASTNLAPMPTSLKDTGAAQGADPLAHSAIYVVAGLDGDDRMVEAYDPRSNQWFCSTNVPAGSGCASKAIPPVPHARTELGAATGRDGRIFVFGGMGCTNATDTTCRSVDVYDPSHNAWSAAGSLAVGVNNFGACTGTDGYIYALGGLAYNGATTEVERYSP